MYPTAERGRKEILSAEFGWLWIKSGHAECQRNKGLRDIAVKKVGTTKLIILNVKIKSWVADEQTTGIDFRTLVRIEEAALNSVQIAEILAKDYL